MPHDNVSRQTFLKCACATTSDGVRAASNSAKLFPRLVHLSFARRAPSPSQAVDALHPVRLTSPLRFVTTTMAPRSPHQQRWQQRTASSRGISQRCPTGISSSLTCPDPSSYRQVLFCSSRHQGRKPSRPPFLRMPRIASMCLKLQTFCPSPPSQLPERLSAPSLSLPKTQMQARPYLSA